MQTSVKSNEKRATFPNYIKVAPCTDPQQCGDTHHYFFVFGEHLSYGVTRFELEGHA